MVDETIIKESQNIIVEVFKGFRDELVYHYGATKHESKNDLSPVTEFDIKIETELKKRLTRTFPEIGFKGEETEPVGGKGDATWLVDPIDSTGSFVHGLPYCSNMAALVVNNSVVASVLYRFVQDELYEAVKGEGAYKDGNKLSIHQRDLSDSYVYADATSYKNLYEYFAPSKLKFFAPVGATGYFLTSIADGTIQAACYFGANIKPHDVAPGLLLVTEAGGEVVSLKDQAFNLRSNTFIVGAPNVCALARNVKQSILQNETKIS